VLTASLQGIPEEEFEAARIDGASAWNGFWFITLPHLIPAAMVILLVRFIDGLKTFALVYTLTAGGPSSSTELVFFHIYKVAFRNFDIGYSSALSLILVVFSILACGLILRLGRRSASVSF
jgi:multiple sugar transport system permease protein